MLNEELYLNVISVGSKGSNATGVMISRHGTESLIETYELLTFQGFFAENI